MLSFLKKWLGFHEELPVLEKHPLPVLDLSIDDVKSAVSQFGKEKPKGVFLSVLIKEDNELDYSLLAPYLGGVPAKKYYMSRETYEIFEDQSFAQMIDQIQKAVDRYVDEVGAFPVVDHDPQMKVSYYKLSRYLKEQPAFETYLTGDENLITWKKPVIH